MYKDVLKGLVANTKDLVHQFDSHSFWEESKSSSPIGESIMDHVNKSHDFSKISENDLDDAFYLLRQRCPKSWSMSLEERAKSFHTKIMILRKESNLSKYFDHEMKIGTADESKFQYGARDLIIAPETWNMQTRKDGIELRELLRHLTIYAPFKGRPFVRAWLEALVPCFSHWILLSDSKNMTVIDTLKHLLGAFGQPGIVVCLEDKGLTLMNSLKDAACAVEALGRGSVERYYWRRLTEANCGGNGKWRELATTPSWSRSLSQLETLPDGWLLDCTDWVHVFANIVSPEISKRFEKLLATKVIDKKFNASIKAGPPKTFARTLAKSHEYRLDYHSEFGSKRWSRFGKRFKKVFGRAPEKPEDFVWNVMDFARCSIVVPSAVELMKVKVHVEKNFTVVCVKNGYSSKVQVKGSGYRDMKLLVQVDFDSLKLEGLPQVQPKTRIICEIQLICEKWLDNKKSTSLSYKVLRAANLKDFFRDFAKYNNRSNEGCSIQKVDATQVIKNGWVNVAKITDFTDINKDKLLLDGAQYGWETSAIELLVRDLDANLESVNYAGMAPLSVAAKNGHDTVVKSLIALNSNLDARDNSGRTALHHATYQAHESCIRILIDSGCSVDLKDQWGDKALDHLDRAMVDHPENKRICKLLRGEHVPLLKTKLPRTLSKINEINTAANEGVLTNYFDSNEVSRSLVSKLLATKIFATRIENSLQVLWFGGDVNYENSEGYSALIRASGYGDLTSVNALLENGANVYVEHKEKSPLHYATKYNTNDVVKALIGARADIESKNMKGHTPLLTAVRKGEKCKVLTLLSAGANIKAKSRSGEDVFDLVKDDDLMKVLQDAADSAYKDLP